MQAFDYNNLFNKAQLYIQRAFSEQRESDLFPFWLALSFEFLARCTLAKINPILLASIPNPRDITSLLYALNIKSTNQPRSIDTTIVFERCKEIINEFTDKEYKTSLAIMEQRNAELHSGVKGFEDYPVDNWLPEFYRICKILLKNQGLDLKDLLGNDEAIAAEKMLSEEVATLKKAVLDRIQAYKKVFSEFSEDEKKEKEKIVISQLRTHIRNSKIVKCPSCNNHSVISGEIISVSEAKLIDEELVEEHRYLPTKFICVACGLKINGYDELKSANLANIYTIKKNLDPINYHNIDVEEYIDIDKLIRERLSDGYFGDEYMDE